MASTLQQKFSPQEQSKQVMGKTHSQLIGLAKHTEVVRIAKR